MSTSSGKNPALARVLVDENSPVAPKSGLRGSRSASVTSVDSGISQTKPRTPGGRLRRQPSALASLPPPGKSAEALALQPQNTADALVLALIEEYHRAAALRLAAHEAAPDRPANAIDRPEPRLEAALGAVVVAARHSASPLVDGLCRWFESVGSQKPGGTQGCVFAADEERK